MKRIGRILKGQSVFVIFTCYFVCCILFVPKFGNGENLLNIVVQSSDLIILSCGMTFVFLNGSMDFSITAVLALSSVVGARILTGGLPLVLAVPAAVGAMAAVGLLIGMINSVSVTRLKIPSFIATMASQLIFAGIALTMTQSNTIGGIPNEFNWIAQGKILGIPNPIPVTVAVVAVSYYLLHVTVYGRRIFSVGTSHRVSIISGLPVKRTIGSLFLLSSLYAVIASILMTARLGAGVPSLGKDMMMDVVAAVVVGGTKVSGGEGRISGSVIGAVLVVMLNNSLNLLGVDWYYITVAKGALILLVSAFVVLRTDVRVPGLSRG